MYQENIIPYSENAIRTAGDSNIINVNLNYLSDLQYWQQVQNWLRTKPDLFSLFINNLILNGRAIGKASGRSSDARQWEDNHNGGLEIFILTELPKRGYNVRIINKIGYRTFLVERNGATTIIPPVLRRDQINDYLKNQIFEYNPYVDIENANIKITICENNHYYLIVKLAGQNEFKRYSYLPETNENCWSCSANSLLNLVSSFGIDVFRNLNLSPSSLKIMSITPKNVNKNPFRQLDEPITITFDECGMSTTYINYKNQRNNSESRQTNNIARQMTIREFVELYGLGAKFLAEDLQWLGNYFIPEDLVDYIVNLIPEIKDIRQWIFDNIRSGLFLPKNFKPQKKSDKQQSAIIKPNINSNTIQMKRMTKDELSITELSINIKPTNGTTGQMTVREFAEEHGINQEKYSDYLNEFKNYYVTNYNEAYKLIEPYLGRDHDKVIMNIGEEINNKDSTIFQKIEIEPINYYLPTETDGLQSVITKPSVNNSNKFSPVKKYNNFAKQYIPKNPYNTKPIPLPKSTINIQKPVISQPPVTPKSSEETTINAQELANNLGIADYFDNSDFNHIGNIPMTEVVKISEIVNGIKRTNINQCNGRNYPTIESKYAIVLLFYITSQTDIGVLQQKWRISDESMGTLVNTVISFIYHDGQGDCRIPNIIRSSIEQSGNRPAENPTIIKPKTNEQNKNGYFIC